MQVLSTKNVLKSIILAFIFVLGYMSFIHKSIVVNTP